MADSKPDNRITIENVTVPGYFTQVDSSMYAAMRETLLKIFPAEAPGLTQTEMRSAVIAYLPQKLFPGGAKAGWWSKVVQLDLEARGILVREPSKPLRWHLKV